MSDIPLLAQVHRKFGYCRARPQPHMLWQAFAAYTNACFERCFAELSPSHLHNLRGSKAPVKLAVIVI